MNSHDDIDVVIVGAGVAGGALATKLARDGCSVLILERTLVHIDRIRGEWLAPWGVLEVKQLGLLDDFLSAGGHYIRKAMRYGDGVPIEAGRTRPFDLGTMVPGIQGVMSLGHPRLCETLDRSAQQAGAKLLRGVGGISVEAGTPPTIHFEHEGERHTLRPRLVVGADGRGSSVGRQIGAVVRTEPVHHLIAGMLVESVEAWPEDEQSVSVHDGHYLLVFPQGGGRMRLYLCYPHDEVGRFSGPRAAANFLEAFRVPTLPHSDRIAGGKIAGPCQGYPNADAWVDQPFAPGVVLIGDSAGHNDPTIGQGLSITMRDVRLVAETLSAARDWDEGVFAPYAKERRERMAKLRFTARLWSKLRCEFDPEAIRRRANLNERLAKNPEVGLALLTPLVGPDLQPREAFGETAVRNMLGPEWCLTEDGWFQQSMGHSAH